MGFPHPTHPKENPVLSKHFGDPDARTFDGWVKRGGYEGLRKVLRMTPEAVIEEIKTSGLRGRGGAGFPTGLKWSLMPKADGRPHYLVCNADESEPGTFKDREIMRWTPHQLIEGCAIAAYAIGAERCYIYIRGEFTDPLRIMQDAIDEATAKGAIGSNVFGSGKRIEMIIHRGAGRLHLRRRDGDAQLDRGQARQSPDQATLSGPGRACSACRRRSTTWRPLRRCRTS